MTEETAGKDPKPPKAPRPRSVDLNALSEAHYVTGEFRPREDESERDARLRTEEAQAAHERSKDLLILKFVLFGLTAICVACLYGALAGQPEDKKWAMSVLASIVSGGLGYLGGRSKK